MGGEILLTSNTLPGAATAGAAGGAATGLAAAAPYVAVGLAAFQFFGSIFSSNKRNEMLRKRAQFERQRRRRQAVGRFLQGQAEVGQLESTLAGGGLDVSSTGLKTLLETSIKSTLEEGYAQADQQYKNILSGQTSAVNTLLGAAASAGTTYFNVSSSLSNLSHSNQMRDLLSQYKGAGRV